MVRTLFAAAAVAALFTTSAIAGEAEQRFVKDGVSYTYTVSKQGSATVFEGTANGEPFRYVLKGDKVTGEVGKSYVSFEYKKGAPLFAQR
jgi:hypothetical protein